MLACRAKGRGFDSRLSRNNFMGYSQEVRQRILIPPCKGSIPFTPILDFYYCIMATIYLLENITYFSLFFYLALSLLISSLLLFLSYQLAIQTPDPEKTSAYECGFEPFEDARNRFDVRFYIVAILFLIFDIEVVFLFP